MEMKNNDKIKTLNDLLHEYMWVFDIENGNKGFIIAENRRDAIDKLKKRYPNIPHIKERIFETDMFYCNYTSETKRTKFEFIDMMGCIYLYGADFSDICGDVFTIVS